MENHNEKLDCLFLHIPKITEKKASILIMSMGIIDINVHFESWNLPKKEFLDSFRESLPAASEIIISPDSHPGYSTDHFTEEEILEQIKRLEEAVNINQGS